MAKKPKGAPEAPSVAAPPPVEGGDRGARASHAWSSLRGLAELAGAISAPMAQVTPVVPLPTATTTTAGAQQAPPQDAVVLPLPPYSPIPPTVVSPTPPVVLEHALAGLDWLRQDLLADPRLVAGHFS